VADLSQDKMVIAPKPSRTFPNWTGIPVRVLLLTAVGTLLCFAVSLLLAILGTIAVSLFRGVHPDMRIAYRDIALPIAVVAAAVILVGAVITEVRNYRQRQALRAIERIS
jgi:uncharacterized membrane protein